MGIEMMKGPGQSLGEMIEITPSHLTYLILSSLLILYTLGACWIRNVLHLSEPPLALLAGIILGPKCLGWLTPNLCSSRGCRVEDDAGLGVGGWGWGDSKLYEISRVLVGLQVFTVAVELPKYYFSRHRQSVLFLLGPVMFLSWIVTAGLGVGILGFSLPTALTVSACLTPTDPVLASSILSNSKFSTRVPKRIKHMLSAESGCNDGISYPFLFAGLFWLLSSDAKQGVGSWFGLTLLYQCLLGTLIGLVLGTVFNKFLRYSERKKFVDEAGFTVFYVLLALLALGIGSTLGVDDFLVAFFAGYGFARDGWFAKKTEEQHLPAVLDLLLNSAMFVYLGTILPWPEWAGTVIAPQMNPGNLVLFALAVIVLRRLPFVLPLYPYMNDIRTMREALFVGHFGPMGLGAIFLSMEARGMLENGSSELDLRIPSYNEPFTDRQRAAAVIWPVISFVVFASTIVHGGLSVAGISIFDHYSRPRHQRAPRIAGEDDPLPGMVHGEGTGDSVPNSEDEHDQREDDSDVGQPGNAKSSKARSLLSTRSSQPDYGTSSAA